MYQQEVVQDNKSALIKQAIKQRRRNKIYEALLWLQYKFTILHAPKRSGKTTTLAALMWWFKKMLNKEIFTIESPMGLTKYFGKCNELSLAEFFEQMQLIDSIARDKRIAQTYAGIEDEMLQKAFMKEFMLGRGVIIYDAVLIMDEMEKLIGKRRTMSKSSQTLTEIFMQMAHYYITFIGTLPNWTWMNKYGIRQLDWKGEVSRNEFTHRIHIDMSGAWPWELNLDGRKYYKLFSTRNILPMSTNAFNIKGLDI